MVSIKRGTARRLGLRIPSPPPGLLVLAPSDLSDEQMEAFKAKWMAAWSAETLAMYRSLSRGRPYLKPAIARAARPRRRWPWSRPSRSDTPYDVGFRRKN